MDSCVILISLWFEHLHKSDVNSYLCIMWFHWSWFHFLSVCSLFTLKWKYLVRSRVRQALFSACVCAHLLKGLLFTRFWIIHKCIHCEPVLAHQSKSSAASGETDHFFSYQERATCTSILKFHDVCSSSLFCSWKGIDYWIEVISLPLTWT